MRRIHAGGCVATLLIAAVLIPGAAAQTAPAPPVLSELTFRPAVLKPGSTGAFRFLTTREGAASIAIARIGTTGRLIPAGRLRFAVDAGPVRRSFDGRVAGRRLTAARYRATLTVTNAAVGASAPRRVTFRMTAR